MGKCSFKLNQSQRKHGSDKANALYSKIGVVRCAEESNNSAVRREYGINEKLVRDWRKNKDKLKKMLNMKCADRGQKCQWPLLEKDLEKWVQEQRQSCLIVTRNALHMLRRKTFQILKELFEG